MSPSGSRQHMLGISLVLLIVVMFHEAAARDLRNVTEPKIPSSCVSLKGNGGEVTAVIQNALDSCAKGKVVHLASGTFVSGPLTISSDVGLWIDSGVVLQASTNATLYDARGNICGTISKLYNGCKPFIHIYNVSNSGIYGKGTIDGQGGSKILGKNQTWRDLGPEAKPKNEYQNTFTLVMIEKSREIILYKIKIINAPSYHVIVGQTNGFTAWGLTLITPESTYNTDGIDPGSSQNITIMDTSISCGDDNIAIKASEGPSRHISVTNCRFGPGHGMSIGSDINYGVSDLTVTNLVKYNSITGLRIKSDRSRGGLVTNIVYSDVCMYNITNPIWLSADYSGTAAAGNFIPDYNGITFNNVNVLTAGKFTLDGFSDEKPLQATLHNVNIVKGSTFEFKHAKISGYYTEHASGSLHC
uniref:Glycoside hydrolase family 28 n=1 Tax=Sipyloidea sipylus TaxID=202427 RepID=A0A191XT53_SIPSI|nr:glycoside hydrolase family 28 [Sipyloidea sipylus]